MRFVRFEYGIYPYKKQKDGGLYLINDKWYHYKGAVRYAENIIELCDAVMCYSAWYCPDIPFVFNVYGSEQKLNKILNTNKDNKIELGIWTKKGLIKVGEIINNEIVLTSKLDARTKKVMRESE